MSSDKPYLRINASVLIDALIDHNGKFVYRQRMRDRIYDVEDYFRSKIIIPCNEMCEGRWHVEFTENPRDEKSFDANIYVEHNSDFNTISSVIRLNFQFVKDLFQKQFLIDLFQTK